MDRKTKATSTPETPASDTILMSPLSTAEIILAPLTEGLRRAIRRSNLGVSELARATGVSKSAISRFLSGKRNLSLASAEKIAGVIPWPIELPRFVVLEVSAFRGQLCKVVFGKHWMGGLFHWEVKKMSEAKSWSELAQEVFRCLHDNE